MKKIHFKFVEKLDRLVRDNIIKNFLINTVSSHTISFGTEGEKSIGCAYAPLITSKQFQGEILIEWKNGKISKAFINPFWLHSFEKNVEELKRSQYQDDSAKIFLKPSKIEKLSAQEDPSIEKNLYNLDKEIISRVKKIKEWGKSIREKSTHVNIAVSTHENVLSNSKGLTLTQRETEVEEIVSLGQFYGFDIEERKLEGLKKEKKHIERAETFYKILKKRIKKHRLLGNFEIILFPYVFSKLLSYFLISNITAESIYYKKSKYKIEDFKNMLKIAKSGFSLTVYPKANMKIGAEDFSPEGWIYPDSCTFVKDGKLQKPITPLRYANLMKISPTPPINSLRLLNFGKIEKSLSLEEVIMCVKNGLLVTEILGLHTQDSTTGNFSLVCPMTILINNGELEGRVDCMIRGNFFNLLKSIERIYKDPLTELPFIKTQNTEIEVAI